MIKKGGLIFLILNFIFVLTLNAQQFYQRKLFKEVFNR